MSTRTYEVIVDAPLTAGELVHYPMARTNVPAMLSILYGRVRHIQSKKLITPPELFQMNAEEFQVICSEVATLLRGLIRQRTIEQIMRNFDEDSDGRVM